MSHHIISCSAPCGRWHGGGGGVCAVANAQPEKSVAGSSYVAGFNWRQYVVFALWPALHLAAALVVAIGLEIG